MEQKYKTKWKVQHQQQKNGENKQQMGVKRHGGKSSKTKKLIELKKVLV